MRGHGKASRLFETGLSEQHGVGELAELGPGLVAQSRLTHNRGNEARVVPVFAQPTNLGDNVEAAPQRGDVVEQAQPFGGEQVRNVTRIHDT